MANRKGETVSRIGMPASKQQDEFDPAPILVTPRSEGAKRKNELDDDDLTEDIQEEMSVVDPFKPAIAKMEASQSPAVRNAIAATPCFARVWYSNEDQDYCSEMECGLRRLCEATYHEAVESVDAEVEAQEELEGIETSEVDGLFKIIEGKGEVSAVERLLRAAINGEDNVEQEDDFTKVKLQGRKLQKGSKSRKTRLSTPYVSKGRHSDKLATMLAMRLAPVELPENWMYYTVRSFDFRKIAQRRFVSKHGGGMLCSKRPSYHIYIYDGMHVLRLWVNASNVAIMDLNPHLATECERVGLKTTVTPPKNPRHSFNFFPKRTKIKTFEQMELAIQSVKATLDQMAVR